MNREIKFRVWNTILNKYVEDEDTIIFSQKGTMAQLQWLGNGYMIMIGSEETHIIEQFTGLLDKNGTEIYEGDVIRREDGRTDYVIFEDGCFVTQNNSWDIRWLIHRINDYDEKVEIIGNIHEATK